MEYTDNLLLNTPQDADGFDVEHFNDNSDFLDGIIGGDVSSIAAGEENNVATQAHAVGSYLTIKNGTMGGKLYKVTSAITVGDVISTSTNVQETSLIKEIKTLQDSLSLTGVTKVIFAAGEDVVRFTMKLPDGSDRHIWFNASGIDFQKNNGTPYWTGH